MGVKQYELVPAISPVSPRGKPHTVTDQLQKAWFKQPKIISSVKSTGGHPSVRKALYELASPEYLPKPLIWL